MILVCRDLRTLATARKVPVMANVAIRTLESVLVALIVLSGVRSRTDTFASGHVESCTPEQSIFSSVFRTAAIAYLRFVRNLLSIVLRSYAALM